MSATNFSPKEVITRCVEEFESRTQVELVVSIKKNADTYYSYFWFYTLGFVQIFWISTLLWNDYFEFELVIVESFFLIGFCYLILVRFEILKYLVSNKVKQKKIEKAAEQEFFNLGMYNTKKRSGLLVMYSHWENRCWLLADKGVVEKVSKEELNSFADDFQKAFQAKDLSESVGSQIRTFGIFWKTRWPNEDDDNEIVHAFQDELK